ncbi:DUF1365 domain-containing protein [Nonomuraea sp. NPDC050394]|uniref:DUF1365 domain-containing protein n=1 Tax=Nonomuraea sp. NPDC050394 TaxID=3364363 RepID=UPI00378CB2B3
MIVYDCVVTHARTEPVRNTFRYRTALCLVDADEPARRSLIAPPAGRGDLDAFLARHELTADRVLTLAHHRLLGWAFDPLRVHWCFSAGRLAATVAEVRNTYGGRHRYLLRPGVRDIAKDLYVSPFNAVDGSYRIDLPVPGERLALTVTLHRTGRPPFAASVRGRAVPAMNTRHLLTPILTIARIHRQGIGLYLRGLTVQPREARR